MTANWLAHWWFAGSGSRFRWCIERWAKWHVFDIEEGCTLSSWRWRPLREWTWRRSYYHGSEIRFLPKPLRRKKA